MATVEFVDATHTYPGTKNPAVDCLNLTIGSGEFMVLLGASGCGKTTALRMLAGLETVDSGAVFIDGVDVTETQPGERDIAMVFQNYALYPQMTVAENLGFHLVLTGAPHSAVARRVRRMAAQLDLTPTLDRLPRTLSGGEQQRVAMGRAMMREPKVFLMDEPLGALDAKLRTDVRSQIVTLQRRLEATTIYVTHDQIEAMTMGDRIAVMKDGVLLQCDTPRALYENPLNAYVGAFVGSPPMNLIKARVEYDWVVLGDVDVLELPLDRKTASELQVPEVTVGFRPDSVNITSPGSGLYAHVEAVENLGYVAYAHCATGVGERRKSIVVRCEPHAAPRPGSAVGLQLALDAVHLFETRTGRRLNPQR
ncbi:ABC transporter ATP-binding protein [Actinocrinis puniceicyclus]|uniref:ABC transporter ATP-binding protein n=1 Tax=Actinocrinis puniceicyclus TaxID=977794 RepID=A0A8J7WLW7_9ACTN|nr:ABC transporter ATP-binding protein [Actinocrinis puniceicyclus]MBS2963678.1 ABC transporter ATP-binding protein [Actinocrinis puniceicyclus]